MTFINYDRISLVDMGLEVNPSLFFYWTVNNNTIRFIDSQSNVQRISNCNTIEQVYEHYNKRFLCLK